MKVDTQKWVSTFFVGSMLHIFMKTFCILNTPFLSRRLIGALTPAGLPLVSVSCKPLFLACGPGGFTQSQCYFSLHCRYFLFLNHIQGINLHEMDFAISLPLLYASIFYIFSFAKYPILMSTQFGSLYRKQHRNTKPLVHPSLKVYIYNTVFWNYFWRTPLDYNKERYSDNDFSRVLSNAQ